jgi:hypothetical protein
MPRKKKILAAGNRRHPSWPIAYFDHTSHLLTFLKKKKNLTYSQVVAAYNVCTINPLRCHYLPIFLKQSAKKE